MKKNLLLLFVLLVTSINLFAVDVKTNNQVTRISEKKVKFDWRRTMPIKSQYYNLYGDPLFLTEFGLDCYVTGGIKQYAIVLKFQYAQLDYPAIIPMGSNMVITTNDNQIIKTTPFLVQSETKYILLPIGHDETASCAYFPISEENLQKLCSGVKTFSFDYMFFDGNSITSDKAKFSGKKLSEKMGDFYKAISKKESKLKNRNDDLASNYKRVFINYDPTSAILLYHGYQCPVFLYEKYLKYSNQKAGHEVYQAYQSQFEDVQFRFNSDLLLNISESVNKQSAAYNSQMAAAGANMQNEMNKLGQTIQRRNAEKAAREQAEKQKRAAEWEARLKNQEQKRQADLARQQQEMAKIASGYNGMDDRNRGAQRQMETSDLAKYNAARMSDAIYGKEATDQALAQQSQYEAEQNQRIRANQQQMQQAQAQETFSGSTTNAVTASGAHVLIKIDGKKVIAYSTSNSTMGGAQWVSVNNGVSITTTRALYESVDIKSRYEYAADIQGIGRVYWGPVQNGRATQSQVPGTVMTAVDKNGRSLSILVNQNEVKGYSLGTLNEAGSEYKWTYSHMKISVRPTNPSDGQFAERFKNKADFPDIGTVYF